VNSDLLHLQTSQQGIAQLSNEERIDWIRQERWIQYPRAKRILERLAELVDYPPRHRMPLLGHLRLHRHGQNTHHSKIPARQSRSL
jgi:hypothetical protein